MLSARNQFGGRIVELNEGDVVGRVTVDIGCRNIASSVITSASISQLGLKVGSTVKVVIKSTDVMLMTPQGLA
ncbi:TOBE domain-containing protein [Clostridium tyrobutyricum]|nr:TOBE domain-containing protein [Clostridium tyrobutyricum]